MAERIKISTFSRGIAVDAAAKSTLTEAGRIPITLHEYATTGGVTFILPGDIYVNAPFDELYCGNPATELTFNAASGSFMVRFEGEEICVRPVPLPGYLQTLDSQGRPVVDVAMSHGDRVRLSPIGGCAFRCSFCDVAALLYQTRLPEQLVDALAVAAQDNLVKARHVLISGGTPRHRDYPYYDGVCRAIVKSTDLPVDVMAASRKDPGWIDDFVAAGVFGFAINVEVYGTSQAANLIPAKARLKKTSLVCNLERALSATGGQGRVRSLVVAGLESIETTLAAIDFIATLGCDPVLSPFRPAAGAELARLPPPSVDYLQRVYLGAAEIAGQRGVKLGPRCIPCQNNTLTFPDQSGRYYFS